MKDPVLEPQPNLQYFGESLPMQTRPSFNY